MYIFISIQTNNIKWHKFYFFKTNIYNKKNFTVFFFYNFKNDNLF